MTGEDRCAGCGHAPHRDLCRAKAPSGCVPLDMAPGVTGFACYRGARPPCPCPHGWCHSCRAPVLGAAPAGQDEEVDIDRDSAGAPAGTWAVRALPDTSLACRPLRAGEEPRAGEWRGTEHHCTTPAASGRAR